MHGRSLRPSYSGADVDGCKSATKAIGIIWCDPDDLLGDRVIRHLELATCFLTA